MVLDDDARIMMALMIGPREGSDASAVVAWQQLVEATTW
jgi:hypothetical protein